MKLRDYQLEAITAIWKELTRSDKALCVLPCGAGKTVIFTEFLKKSVTAKNTLKAIIIFDRVKLLSQIDKRISKELDEVGVWCASLNRKEDKQITVASIKSLPKDGLFVDLIIWDECHIGLSDGSAYLNFINSCITLNPKLKIIGFTATPFTYDGYIYGANKFWKSISYKKDIKWFIDNNYLCRPICKEPDYLFDTSKLKVVSGEYDAKSVGEMVADDVLVKNQVIDALNRSIDRKKIVWFCSNISHAEKVNHILKSFGEHSSIVHSELSLDQQDAELKEFEDGNARHLVFITIVSTGYDYAPIDCVVLMRPTKSPSLYIQTVGRALRPSPGKENALILDYASVIKENGPIDNPIVQKKTKGESKPPVRTCPECRAINHISFKECEQCGYTFPPPPPSDRQSLAADHTARVLSDEEITMAVKSVVFNKHTSKTGNACEVIEYHSGVFFEPPVKEYFVTTNAWAMSRFAMRQAVANKITHIVYNYEGKYPRIKRVITNESI